jgi:hypothetical protein
MPERHTLAAAARTHHLRGGRPSVLRPSTLVSCVAVAALSASACSEEEDLDGDYVPEGSLISTVGVTDLSGSRGGSHVFYIELPEDVATLEIRTSGGTGNLDLYLAKGAPPPEEIAIRNDEELQQFRNAEDAAGEVVNTVSVGSSNEEVISIPRAGVGLLPGRYYVRVYGRGAYAGATITATATCERRDGKALVLSPTVPSCRPGSTPGGSGTGEAIASCSDGKVCSEILEGNAAAYADQCSKEGNQGSTAPCDASYKGGPACLGASFTASGQRVKGNFFWKPDYCASTNNQINTYGTCCDLSGRPTGTHCRNVTTCD